MLLIRNKTAGPHKRGGIPCNHRVFCRPHQPWGASAACYMSAAPQRSVCTEPCVKNIIRFGNTLRSNAGAACHFLLIKIKPDTLPVPGGPGTVLVSVTSAAFPLATAASGQPGEVARGCFFCSCFFSSASAFAVSLESGRSSSCRCFLQCFSKVEILAYVRQSKQWYGCSAPCVPEVRGPGRGSAAD